MVPTHLKPTPFKDGDRKAAHMHATRIAQLNNPFCVEVPTVGSNADGSAFVKLSILEPEIGGTNTIIIPSFTNSHIFSEISQVHIKAASAKDLVGGNGGICFGPICIKTVNLASLYNGQLLKEASNTIKKQQDYVKVEIRPSDYDTITGLTTLSKITEITMNMYPWR